MSICGRCEILPAGWPEVGILYVSPPLAHTRGTLRRLLWESGLPFGDPFDGILAVEVAAEGLRRLCKLLFSGLSEVELKDCKAVLVEKDTSFSLGMLSRMQDLATLMAMVQGEWLFSMLRENRLIVHFQPIVSAVDPGKVFAYECLLRGLDERGDLVNPRRMYEVAKQAGLLYNLDLAARIKAVDQTSALGLESNIFINFNPASIYDPRHCFRSTIDAIRSSSLSPDQIIFKVTESEEIKDRKHLREILDFCRKHGFRIALDDLGAGYASLDLLTAIRPDFVKLDMHLVQDVDRNPYRAVIASKLLEFARDLGVTVVAEGVETEEQWRWLVAHGADFVQGYFFSRPAFPPPLPTPHVALPSTTHNSDAAHT